MQNALKTIEEGNLYSRFGLVEGLSEDEMMDVDGGGRFSWAPGPNGQPCVNVSIKIGSPSRGSGGSSGSSKSSGGSNTGSSRASSSGSSSRSNSGS